MNYSAQKMRDFYAMKKNAPIVQEEFWLYTLDMWIEQGHLKDEEDANKLFGFDKPSKWSMGELGWCESAFCPEFEEIILEDRGAHELVQDKAGRGVLYFKGRRNGFMPEFITHPVTDRKTWENNVKWRLDPLSPERYKWLPERMADAKECEDKGFVMSQSLIGGYMYLRSLLGPEGALYLFYDDPELIHDLMKKWFELSDYIIATHQKHVVIDEIFFAEDICYNGGPLISPDMIREFLFPYYKQLITNAKSRQLDKSRKLFIQVDTDGDCRPVIDLYTEIGMDYMSPFEVASGCDVVEIRKKYPNLLMRGGFDKRILATTKDEIAREVHRIMPFMKECGGYIPTIDHGVPTEVSFENYLYYRTLMMDYR